MATLCALKSEPCVLFLQLIGAVLPFRRDDDDDIRLLRRPVLPMLVLFVRAVLVRAHVPVILTLGLLLQLLHDDLSPLLYLGLFRRLQRTGGEFLEVAFLLLFCLCEVEDECVKHVCVADKPVEIVVGAVGFLCQLPARLVCDHVCLRHRHLLLVYRSR
jgi:hypothetical protein